MRIDYLSGSQIPSRTGNSVNVMKMCSAFGSQGHQVTLYARKGSPAADDPYTRYGVKNSFSIRSFPWPDIRVIGPLIYIGHVFLHLLRSPRPDLFYSRYSYLLFMASFLGVPCIYEAHKYPRNPVRRGMEVLLMRRKNLRRLIVISDALGMDYLDGFSNLAPQKIIVAHDGADLPMGNSDESIGRERQPETRTPRVGYVGQLNPGKAMEIVSQLAPRFPDLVFHVIGGRDADLDFWKARTEVANLRFHGYVNPGDLDRYYRELDIMLVPFLKKVTLEGGKGDTSRWMSPLKVFEYMAHGKAIISSDHPVLREVLEDRVTAIMVAPGDIDAWTTALEELSRDRALILRLGQAARSLLEAEYTWDKRVARVLSDADVSATEDQ